MKQSLSENILITLLIAAVFLWQKSDLTEYTIPLLGLLTFTYLITSFSKKNKLRRLPVFLLTACSLLLILSTGGINSVLFFLLYFLSFTIAFLLTPKTVFIFNVVIFLSFLPDALQADPLTNLVKIGSLILLCPIAYFFGREIQTRDKKDKKTQEKLKQIESEISDVVKTTGANMKEPEVEKLADVIKQTRELEKENK